MVKLKFDGLAIPASRPLVPQMIFPLKCAFAATRSDFTRWFCASAIATILVQVGASVGHAEPSSIDSVDRFLREQCFDCHQGEEAEANLDLETFAFDLVGPTGDEQVGAHP